MKIVKEIFSLLGLISIIALCGCLGSSLNNAPPEYIKSVSAIKEGDGLQIYFILADKNGQETTSTGFFEYEIKDSNGRRLVYHSRNIQASDFQKVKLGVGAFEHEGIILNAGRIPYSEIKPTTFSGKVIINFTAPGGKKLYGDSTVIF